MPRGVYLRKRGNVLKFEEDSEPQQESLESQITELNREITALKTEAEYLKGVNHDLKSELLCVYRKLYEELRHQA